MSRRMLRKSSMKKSPLFRPSLGNKETSNNEAFLFEVESMDWPLSPNSDNLRETNIKGAKKKSNSVLKTALKERPSECNKFLSGISLSSSTSAKKKKDSNESKTEDVTTVGIKKVRRKKKLRYTQDLNAIQSTDGNCDIGTKKKSKKTKKARLPSFLPPVDMIDEDKKMYVSGSSGSCTSDFDIKGKESETETNMKIKKGRSRRTKKGCLVKRNSDMTDDDTKAHLLVSAGNHTLDSDNKENNTDSEENFKIGRGRSRRAKRNTLLNKNSEMLYHENENKLPVVQDNTVGTTLAGNSIVKNPDKLDAFIGNSICDSFVNTTASDENHATTKQPKLRREGTFEISSLDPEHLFSLNSNNTTSVNKLSTRETFDVVPRPRNKNRGIAEKISIFNGDVETVDLTDSVRELGPSPSKKVKRGTIFYKSDLLKGTNNAVDISGPSPSKKLKRDTFDKNKSLADMQSRVDINTPSTSNKLRRSTAIKKSLGSTESSVAISPRNKISSNDRKSSFEVSFNYDKKHPSEELLDNLNITRRDSRKSSYKKSSTGFKCSTGSEDENNKGNFVTLRRQYHTMIDFDTGNSSHEFISDLRKCQNDERLNEEKSTEKSVSIRDGKISSDSSKCFTNSKSTCTKNPSPKKGILKKSVGRFTRDLKRDTFEMIEGYYESLEKIKLNSIPTTSTIAESMTPDNSATTEAHRDIFELVAKTPTVELGHMMIGSEESVLLANSFVNQTNKSMAPRLTRMGTFTKEEKTPQSSTVEGRKSTRRRWSQVERTPIIGSIPKAPINASLNVTKTKSVMFCSPAFNVTPKKIENKTSANKPKAKKSVKIESPLNTPKIRLHSPLVARKTPKPVFSGADSSILAGNCAFSEAYMSPPSSSSTPFPKKKEVSLLKKVLTNEKTNTEKNKNSSRVKMPNFRKIHERQFEKMENIKELQERKAVRAQYLLSGCKLPANESPSGVAQKESRKKLLFTPLKSDEHTKKVYKSRQHMLNKRASSEKKKELKSKVPVLLGHQVPLKMRIPKSPAQGNSVPKAVSKPVQHLLNKRGSLDKKKAELPKPESKVVSRFGFKLPAKEKLTKEEQIKAVSTKSKLATNRTAENRKQVAIVRTNRRFELLMQMRSKKK